MKSVVHLTGLTGSRILNTPFAFTGKLSPLHWEAEVKITYRGSVLTFRHTSAPLVLGIPAFRSLVYNTEKDKISPEEALQPGAPAQRRAKNLPVRPVRPAPLPQPALPVLRAAVPGLPRPP